MRTKLLVAAVAVACCISAALAGEREMRVRFGGLYSMPTDDLAESGATTEADDALGFQAAFEFPVTDKIGIEPTLSLVKHEVEVEGPAIPEFELGEIDFFALTVNVNFRVLERERVGLYVGPTVGYVFWGDLETNFFGPPEKIDADDEFTFGANFGVDVPCGKGGWGFAAGLTYLFTDVTLKESGASSAADLGVDPLLVHAGISYRF